MAHLNKVMLIGRLVADPEPAVTFADGGKLVRFSLFVGITRRNTNAIIAAPSVVPIEARNRDDRRRLADLVEQYLVKGREIYLEGRLRIRGDRSTAVIAEHIEFLDPPPLPAAGECDQCHKAGVNQFRVAAGSMAYDRWLCGNCALSLAVDGWTVAPLGGRGGQISAA